MALSITFGADIRSGSGLGYQFITRTSFWLDSISPVERLFIVGA